VTFEVTEGEKGMAAVNVKPLQEIRIFLRARRFDALL
jgi:hypothetical protein